MRVLRHTVLLAVFAWCAGPLYAQKFQGRVVGVFSGDSINVLAEGMKQKREVRVRLHGIDCPDTDQPMGARAKQATSQLAMNKDVTVDVRDIDLYRRLVADVYVDGRNINAALVESGNARAYTKYSQDYAAQEQAAKAARRGIWVQAGAAPWDLRRSRTESVKSAALKKAASLGGTRRSLRTPDVVYVAGTGKSYHRDGCIALLRNRSPLALSEAKKTRKACPLCNP